MYVCVYVLVHAFEYLSKHGYMRYACVDVRVCMCISPFTDGYRQTDAEKEGNRNRHRDIERRRGRYRDR